MVCIPSSLIKGNEILLKSKTDPLIFQKIIPLLSKNPQDIIRLLVMPSTAVVTLSMGLKETFWKVPSRIKDVNTDKSTKKNTECIKREDMPIC